MNRRNFIKESGLAGAALGSGYAGNAAHAGMNADIDTLILGSE